LVKQSKFKTDLDYRLSNQSTSTF